MPSRVPPRLGPGSRVPPVLASAAHPAIPPEGDRPEGASGAVLLRGRLHPLTLVLALFTAARNFLVPAAVVFFTRSESSLGIILLVSLGIYLVQRMARYFTFSYRIENGELVTRSGLLERRERHIPLSRVQDLRIEQGLVQRLLRVAEVQVETAGGQGAEASLSVLSRAEAGRLREALLAEAARLAAAGGEPRAGPTEAEVEELRGLSVGELILAGLTPNRAASALVLLLAGWQVLGDWLPKGTRERLAQALAENLERWVEQGTHGAGLHWGVLLAGVFGLVAAGMLISAAGSVVLFHGFTLSRRGEDLQRKYGLLTQRASSLPRRRIQLLLLEETWLRRIFKLVVLRVDTASSRSAEQGQGRDGRDVLLPAVPRRELGTLLPAILPALAEDRPRWFDVSRCAIRRGTLKGAVVCVLLALASGVTQGPKLLALWPLALIPVVYAINLLNYKNLGYALSERHFRTRRGWLNRSTHIVPVRNVQSVVLRQNPFDRRLGVVTLIVDTAGQTYTGGGPRMRNVPSVAARTVARAVADLAGGLRYSC